MRFSLLTAMKDLTRTLRDPIGLIIWITMPAMITALVSLISTGPEPIPQGKLLVVDHDQSFASGLLTGAFNREPLSKMVAVEHVELAAGRKQMDAGDASALLEIPKGFGDAVMERAPSRLTLTTNPSQRIVPKLIEQVLSGVLDAGFYLQAAVPRLPDPNKPLSDAEFIRTALSVRAVLKQTAGSLDPALITLETTATGEQKKPFSLPALFFPGMLMMAVFGLAQTLSQDWWTEKQSGTLRRLMTTPRPLAGFLAGKLISVWIVCLGVAAFGLTVAKWLIQSQVENFFVAMLWLSGAGVALYLLNLVLQLAAPDQRSGVVINQLAFFVLSMIGGSFFPFELMPKWLANIGRLTPNGFAVARFKEMTAGTIAAANIGIGFACLAAFLAASFLVLVNRIRKWAV